MSSILSRVAEGETEQSDSSLVRAFEMALEEAESERSGGSQDGKVVRPFLFVDLGAVLDSVRGKRGGTTDVVEDRVEETLQMAKSEGGRSDGSGGRGMLSKLFLLGAVVGLGYVLRKRSGSVDRAVSQATDRAREIADETAMRSGEVAQRTEAVAGEAADQIEESGEMAADQVQEGSETAAEQVREGGEMAADQVQEGGQEVSDDIEQAADTAEDAESAAEDKADEMSSDGSGGDEESEE